MSSKSLTEKAAVEDELSELFLRFSSRDDEIKGFAGRWTFYAASGASDEDISSTFRCLRTYEVVDEDAEGEEKFNSIRFRTFNEFEPSNGSANRRSIDGVFESSHLRLSSDLFFSDNTSLSAAEKDKDVPDCVFWRSVALDKENVMRMAPRLPPRTDMIGDDEQFQEWAETNRGTSVFAFEAFFLFGDERWSMGALYSTENLQLLSHFCIQETLASIDPSKPINFDDFHYLEPQGRLDSNVMSWLDEGNYKGEMIDLVWDEDGETMKMPPRPANWNPPDGSSTTHKLYLYNNGCYAYYPTELPEVDMNPNNRFGEGARFEMGVYNEKDNLFRRLILRYSASGQAVSLTKEIFKAEGSFDFDRRQSQSVRRSLHARRNASSRKAVPEAPARTPEDRAAALHGAFASQGSTEGESQPVFDPNDNTRAQVMDQAALARVMENSSLYRVSSR